MNTVRAFIAIDIQNEIQQKITAQIAGLKEKLGGQSIRWVNAEKIHLTLKFLGDISTAGLENLKNALDEETWKFPPFTMTLNTLGAFPNARRARVIFQGISAPSALGLLQGRIESLSTRLGYPAELKKFSPHLTLARVESNPPKALYEKIRAVVEASENPLEGILKVSQVTLYKSELHRSGAIYSKLHESYLKD